MNSAAGRHLLLGGLITAVLLLAVVVISGSSFWRERTTITVQAEAGLQTNDVIFQAWDSGLSPHADGDNTYVFWLDDSTVVFAADKEPKPTSLSDAWIRRPWLFLWRLGEKPRPLGDDPEEASRFYRAGSGEVCFQQKKIDPTTGEASEVLMAGPPGREQEGPPWKIRLNGLPLNGIPSNIEPIDCRQYVDPAMAGRVFTTDSYHKYYLDRTAYPPGLPPNVGENPVLMRSDGADRRALPIPPKEVGLIYFRVFDNVFWILENPVEPLLRGDESPAIDGYVNWKNTNCLAVWRVDPSSASTERACIPYGPWSGHEYGGLRHGSPIMSLVPTSTGLFFTSTDYADGSATRVGPSGLYKLEHGGPKRVLAGYLQHATASPSGCRMAFVYGPNWESRASGTPGAWTIAAIDLCSSSSRTQDR